MVNATQSDLKGLVTSIYDTTAVIDLCNKDGVIDLEEDIDPFVFRADELEAHGIKLYDVVEFSEEEKPGAISLEKLTVPGFVQMDLGNRKFIRVIS